MNYSDVMDAFVKKGPKKDEIRIPFPIDGRVGELQEATIAFRIVSQDLMSATIQILDFKTEQEAPADNPTPGVIPLPS